MKMHNRGKLRCTAIIIAGGQSKRMGRDKRFLKLGGESFIERVLKVASSFAMDVIVSLASREQADKLQGLKGFRVVLDEKPGRGPAQALVGAARHAKFNVVAVLPVDAPLVVPELYRVLIGELKGYDAAVPVLGGFPEPLHAVYNRRAVMLPQAPESMNQLLNMLNVNFVPEEKLRREGIDTLSFMNVNTPEEYRKLVERWKDEG